MQIQIRIKNNYGIEMAYPVCDKAILFAKIAGDKTLTHATLQNIKTLGYEIVIAEQIFKTFKHSQTA